jgi:hypothetical protein
MRHGIAERFQFLVGCFKQGGAIEDAPLEFGVECHRCFHLGRQFPQLLVLHLQLDLPDLQFVEQPLGIVR